jgi:membrane fusion protein (multidrug efflux system)
MPRRFPGFFLALLAMAAVLPLAACGGKETAASGKPPQVGVVTLQPERVSIANDLPGRTSAVRIAEVRARVDGVVIKREFTEGSDVRAGQRLYKIDPAPYQAVVDSAAAALAKAEAHAMSTGLISERSRALVTMNAISRQEQEIATATHLQAKADVAAAKAALQAARIDLEYTDVTAPIAGRIGKSMVTEGAYVRQNEATLLATLQQLDTIYVDVAQSSMDLLRLRREFESGELQRTQTDGARVALTLEDGSIYAEAGALQFSDISVDPGTGTITLRALFPNPQHALLPGMFVHARIEAGIDKEALLVPQQGVTYDLKGQPTALVVGADEKVELRHLQLGRSIDNRWLIAGGLQAGDRVIVEGLQKVRPGVAVQAVATATAAAGNPVASAAAAH